jgi:hypothetical protein
MTYVRAPTD